MLFRSLERLRCAFGFLLTSIDDFGDSTVDFSVARFIIKNPNIIAPTKRPNINIGPTHSNTVLQESGVKRSFNDINGFCFINLFKSIEFGGISRDGVLLFSSSMDHIGIFTKDLNLLEKTLPIIVEIGRAHV